MRSLVLWTAVLSIAVLPGAAQAQPAYRIETIAGSSLSGDGGPATAAQLGNIQGVVTDRLGNLYLADTDNHRVRKVLPDGTITTIAGTGTPGFSGDGGPALSAQLNLPYGLAADLAGNIFIADLGNNRVRRIAADGTISTLAGGGGQASPTEGGLATDAQLLTPRNLAVDPAGNLYISEFTGHRVRRVAAGRIYTVAGTGISGFWGDGGLAVNAQLAFPAGLAFDRGGNLYIADAQNQRIRRILSGNIMSTVLGGSPATALFTPLAVAVDNTGNIFVADNSDMVHSYSVTGVWKAVSGTGASGFTGDGGAASAAQLAAPRDLAFDLSGNLYIADGIRIRQITPASAIRTVAGDGYLHAIGDGGPATAAQLSLPSAITLDFAGNLFIADTGTQRIRQVTPSGIIATIAGAGIAGYKGDPGPATAAQLNSPGGIAIDPGGSLVITDTINQRIRRVTGGIISTTLGTGVAGSGPEGTAPLQTPLRSPLAICFDLMQNEYVVDTLNSRVLRAPNGALVTTAAGNGAAGSLGDGGTARTAQLNLPSACTANAGGDLFIADTQNHRIRKVTAAGIISTVAGNGTAGAGGDEGPAISASLYAPRGIAVDGSGNIFIADTGNNRIRMVTPDGVIHSIAGTGNAGFAGDGAAALSALLQSPGGLTVDGSGDVYLADTGNNRIRRLVPQPIPPPTGTGTSQTAPATPTVTLTVQNAASQQPGSIAPGELITISGAGLGPESGVAGLFDASGLVANLVAGTEIHFDGVAAPVFYAQYSQVTVQVPYTVAGQDSTHIDAIYQGKTVASADVPVVDAAPGLFPQILNQDGTINSAEHPAVAGSIVTFSATGSGVNTASNIAGLPAVMPFASPQQPVLLSIGGAMALISYSGSAPKLVGVLQVDAAVPDNLPSGQNVVQLGVGTALSPAGIIWLQ